MSNGLEVTTVAALVANPGRLAILRYLRPFGHELSPLDCARLHPPINKRMCAYYLRELVEADVVEIHDFRRVDGNPRSQLIHRFHGTSETGEVVGALVDLWDGVGVVDDGNGAAAARRKRKLEDGDVMLIGKALSHPIRLQMIRDYEDGRVQSVVSYWKENSRLASHSKLNYHFEWLADCSVFKLVRTRSVRGGTEHFYALRGRLAKRTVDVFDVLEGKVAVVRLAHLGQTKNGPGGSSGKVLESSLSRST